MTDDTYPSSPPPTHSDPDRPIGKPRSVGLTILISIITLGIWTWVWSYWNGEELKLFRHDGLGGVAYLIITIFIAPVTMLVMASEVEQMYRDADEEPKITTLWGLWFLLPLIGNIIWYVRMQNAINEFWQARGGTMNPGLT